MKPHEETWVAEGAEILTGAPARAVLAVVDREGTRESDHARARLAAQAPAMSRLLLEARAEIRGEGWGTENIDNVLRDAGVIP